ncbi:MAG TPA: ATP-binding cassette domain-containing protein [Limnobacter sp.]|uniref:ATP-binding cassette domain-containing protein n=1 Tax=Limnobacter sp. TaxID=2003368 RepID=UPI002E346428|nr:ATP-binding cassette domain-containing protein [Limnobacter sp.]HEX5485413.1 ATP-binding cassette domain-containing protein [Limnobacter sp.]
MLSPQPPTDALITPLIPGSGLLPLAFDEVTLTFRQFSPLNGVSLRIASPGITAIMGPNGAGKSLMLRLLGGLIEPVSGQVRFGEQNRVPRGHIGYVFQTPVLLRRSVKGNLMHALKLAGVARPERKERASALLKMGELHHLADNPARSLSGGEKQRLALLRALACKPALLLLDEPSASLDPQATFLIESLVSRASRAGVKVVLISHDQGQVGRLADEVVFVHKGRVLEQCPAGVFLKSPESRQAKAYLSGQLLLD